MISRYKKARTEIENNAIKDFVVEYNKINLTDFRVLDRGNPEVPPDGIICDGSKTIWVEHTEIYRKGEEAELNFHLTGKPGDGPKHPGPYIASPDIKIADCAIDEVNKKFSKESYKPLLNTYGRGILLLVEQDPLFSESTLNLIEDRLSDTKLKTNEQYFSSIYIAFRFSGDLLFRYKLVYSL